MGRLKILARYAIFCPNCEEYLFREYIRAGHGKNRLFMSIPRWFCVVCKKSYEVKEIPSHALTV